MTLADGLRFRTGWQLAVANRVDVCFQPIKGSGLPYVKIQNSRRTIPSNKSAEQTRRTNPSNNSDEQIHQTNPSKNFGCLYVRPNSKSKKSLNLSLNINNFIGFQSTQRCLRQIQKHFLNECDFPYVKIHWYIFDRTKADIQRRGLFDGFVQRICSADLFDGILRRICLADLLSRFVRRFCSAGLIGRFVQRICLTD